MMRTDSRDHSFFVGEPFKEKKPTRSLSCNKMTILALKILFSGGIILLFSKTTRLELSQVFKTRKSVSRPVFNEAQKKPSTMDKVKQIFDEVFESKAELDPYADQLSSEQGNDIYLTAMKVARAIFDDASKLNLFKDRSGVVDDKQFTIELFKGICESVELASKKSFFNSGIFPIPIDDITPTIQKIFGENIFAVQDSNNQVSLLIVQERVGKGTFNSVSWAIEFPTGKFKAYREIIDDGNQKNLLIFQEENLIHQQMQEIPSIKKHVVKLHCAFEKKSILALCEGTITQTPLSQEEAKKVIGDIVRGLAAMHQKGYVHSDIKPDNLFVKRTKAGSVKGKIGDFGGTFQSVQKRSIVGSHYYFSPESFKSQIFSSASDCWALGITLYEFKYKRVENGQVELPTLEFLDKILKVGKGDHEKIQALFKEGDKEIQKRLNSKDPYDQVIKALLNLNAKKRMSAENALKKLQKISAHHFIRHT